MHLNQNEEMHIKPQWPSPCTFFFLFFVSFSKKITLHSKTTWEVEDVGGMK